MKKILIVAGVIACSALQTYAQGQFVFANGGITPSAPVYVGSLTSGVKTDATYSFDYIYTSGTTVSASALTTEGITVTGIANGLFNGSTQILPVTGTITAEIRGWKTSLGATYDTAYAAQGGNYTGTSTLLTISLGNPAGSPPSTATKLGTILSSFYVITPEPSTIALGAMGLSLLVFRRRK
jgi:hypothetical protein